MDPIEKYIESLPDDQREIFVNNMYKGARVAREAMQVANHYNHPYLESQPFAPKSIDDIYQLAKHTEDNIQFYLFRNKSIGKNNRIDITSEIINYYKQNTQLKN